jgi:hypothetical protein
VQPTQAQRQTDQQTIKPFEVRVLPTMFSGISSGSKVGNVPAVKVVLKG